METNEFKPIRTLSIQEFCKLNGLKGISIFEGKNGTFYAGETEAGHKGSVCFLSKKVQDDPRSVKEPVVSEFYKVDKETGEVSKTETYWCLHTQGGMEAIVTF